jgi:hypothetical protein
MNPKLQIPVVCTLNFVIPVSLTRLIFLSFPSPSIPSWQHRANDEGASARACSYGPGARRQIQIGPLCRSTWRRGIPPLLPRRPPSPSWTVGARRRCLERVPHPRSSKAQDEPPWPSSTSPSAGSATPAARQAHLRPSPSVRYNIM